MQVRRIFSLCFSTFLLVLSLVSCSKPGDLTIQRAIKSYQSGDYDSALALFRTALEEDSHYSPELVYNFIAGVYLQQDDIENAVVYQELSVELRPDYRNYVSLGMSFHLLGEDDKAEDAYKKAILMIPEKGEAYASLGALYLGQNRIDEAVANLQKAAEYEPKIAVIHANLAVAYAAAGEAELSEVEFQTAADLKCENLEDFRLRAKEFY